MKQIRIQLTGVEWHSVRRRRQEKLQEKCARRQASIPSIPQSHSNAGLAAGPGLAIIKSAYGPAKPRSLGFYASLSCGSNSLISSFLLSPTTILDPALASAFLPPFFERHWHLLTSPPYRRQPRKSRGFVVGTMGKYSLHTTWVSLACRDPSISRMKACFWHGSAVLKRYVWGVQS